MENFAKKICEIMRAHWFILVNAVIMALLIVSPFILFPILSGPSYRGINVGETDDFYYLTRGKDILEGHTLGNPYFREGKDSEEMRHTFIEQTLVYPLHWLGITSGQGLVTTYNFYNGLGVFLLLLLVYLFVWQLTRNKLLATITALSVVGGYHYIIFHEIKTLSSAFSFDVNIYGRLAIFPIWSSVPFFIFLNLLAKSLRNSNWKYLVGTGLAFGALFYIYFFCWSFALALLGSLWLITLLRRDYQGLKKITGIIILGIILGLYNLIGMYTFRLSDIGQQILFLARVGGYGRLIKISGLSVCLTILLLIFIFRRKNDPNWPLFLSITLAGWIALNQQIITNQLVQDFHYSRYFVYPTTIIMGLYMVSSLWRNPRYQRILLLILLVFIYTDTIARQHRGIQATFDIKNYAQQYRPIVDYLDRQEPSVVLSSDMFYGDLIPIYTRSDLFWSNMAKDFSFPIQRLEDVLDVYYYLNKKSRDNFSDFIYNFGETDKVTTMAETMPTLRYYPLYDLSSYKIKYNGEEQVKSIQKGNFYDIYRYLEAYQIIFLSPDYGHKPSVRWTDAISLSQRQQVITQLNNRFQYIRNNPTKIIDILKKYQVRYFIWDAVRQPEWDFSVLPGLKEVLTSNNIHLYYLAY